MGVMSRLVLPACADVCCCFCPELRARSRKPIQRHKQYLTAIFANSEDGSVNERQIGKLAEYAAENPDRIPKIAAALEERGVRELQAGRPLSLNAVMRCFSKLVAECNDNMTLLAGPVLSMVTRLLESKVAGTRALACDTLTDFVDCQEDLTHASSLESVLPSVLAVAGETSSAADVKAARASALSAIRAMICFAARFGRFLDPARQTQVLSAALDSYSREGAGDGAAQQAGGAEGGSASALAEARASMTKAASGARLASDKISYAKHFPQLSGDQRKQPEAAAVTCVWAMALLASSSGGTAVLFRSSLSSVLQYIANGPHWLPASPPGGLGFSVLRDLLEAMKLCRGLTGRWQDGEVQLLSALAAFIADPSSLSNNVARDNALTLLLSLLRATPRPADAAAAAAAAADGKAAAELQAVSDLAGLLAASLESEFRQAGGVLPQQQEEGGGGEMGVPRQVVACVAELARLVANESAVTEAAAAPLEAMSADVGPAWAAGTAVEQLVRGVKESAATAGGGSGSGADAAGDVLFRGVLLLLSHPDKVVRAVGHSLVATVLGTSSSRSGGAAAAAAAAGAGQRVVLTPLQRLLLLSALSGELDRHAVAFAPEEFVSTSATFAAAVWAEEGALAGQARPADLGGQSLDKALQLALALRAKATDTASVAAAAAGGAGSTPLSPSSRRSLFSLATAMLLTLAQHPCMGQAGATVQQLAAALRVVDPFLRVGSDGQLDAVGKGGPASVGYGSNDDSRQAEGELAKVAALERENAQDIAQAVAAAVAAGPDEAHSLQKQLLEGFRPDESLSLLRQQFLLSSQKLPPGASPSVVLIGARQAADVDAEVLAQARAATAVAVDALGPQGGAASAEVGADAAAAAKVPSASEVIQSLPRPASTNGRDGDGEEGVERALAILSDI